MKKISNRFYKYQKKFKKSKRNKFKKVKRKYACKEKKYKYRNVKRKGHIHSFIVFNYEKVCLI